VRLRRRKGRGHKVARSALELKKAAAGGDTTQVSIALQMVLGLESIERRPNYAGRATADSR